VIVVDSPAVVKRLQATLAGVESTGIFGGSGDVADMIEAAQLRIPDITSEATRFKIRPVAYLRFLPKVAAE
jgi:hypothetical protein